MQTDLPRLLAVARGEDPADLLLKGGRVVNVFTGEILEADVAIAGTRIAGLGPGYRAREVVDLAGRYLCPGFIDAHVHIESAMVPPSEFASVVLPHGVTAVVADPHEIANVLGIEGIRYMLADARNSPLTVFATASSCVPATHLATAGAELTAADLASLKGEVLGLAEVMNFPGVIAGDPAVLDKIHAFADGPIDGHGPGLDGMQLNAYLAAGIRSDHECTTLDEARRKLRLGMTIFIREGSVARDLESLLPVVSVSNQQRICFCTDDRHISDLIEQGSIDHVIRTAISRGLDPPLAIRMATLNVADHFGLRDRGAIAPGRIADIVVFDDLDGPRPDLVYAAGRLAAKGGATVGEHDRTAPAAAGEVRVDWPGVSLEIPAASAEVRVIGHAPGSLLTEQLTMECRIENGLAVSDPSRDMLKMAVIERHRGTGNVGLGFVKGLGLQRGAIASTVAHDHHNLLVAGADDGSMVTAARAVAEAGGGLAAAVGGDVLGVLPLPVAGLMSDMPYDRVAERLERVVEAAKGLGSGIRDPFMALSFLALEVIPSLKLTDRGLVDVGRMQLVPLFVSPGEE